MAQDGWVPPWSSWWGDEALAQLLPDAETRDKFAAGCPQLPLALFDEIHPVVAEWRDARCAYLQLSDAYEEAATQARGLGWPVVTLRTHHLALFTDPEIILPPLLELIESVRH